MVVLLIAMLIMPDQAALGLPGALAQAPTSLPGLSSRRVIVRLKDAPLARAMAPKPGLAAAESAQYVAKLAAAQQQLEAAIRSDYPGATVEHRYQLTFNGLAVRLPQADAQAIARIRSLPGVAAVYEEAVFTPTLYSSVPAIEAPALWETLGGVDNAGTGIKIAILDSGIDLGHPMFASTTFTYPVDFPKGDTRYTTPKVIAARAYFRPANPPLPGEGTPRPGQLGSGHGTHVAGIAAGEAVTATYRELDVPIVGVAPRAWLMNYRIFYPADNTGQEMAFTAEILQAIEDAVSDGADVLYNGWSNATPRLPFASPETEALDAAIEAGCVVVAPAGNEGPGYGSASRIPGGMERAITVGSVSKDRVVAYDLVDVVDPGPVPAALQAQPFARALFGTQISTVFGPFPYKSVAQVAPDNALACQPLPDDLLTGEIALIARGECDFADKAYNVQQAGALLALIYNDVNGAVEMSCGGTHCASGDIHIPAVMVSYEYGQALLTWLSTHPAATLQLDPNGRIISTIANLVQASSGRGPAYMRSLKPDIVAPGAMVLSAYHDRSGAAPYAQLSGTSMAAAHVAGAAALLLQLHPDWDHDDIKAALMGTAHGSDINDAVSAAPAGVLARGAGLIDLSEAGSPGLLLSPPSLSLPFARPGQSSVLSVSARSVDDSAPRITYTLSAEITPTGQIALSVPARVAVGQGARVAIPVTITVSAGAEAGDVEAVVSLEGGDYELQLPVWVHIEPVLNSADVLVIDNDFSFFDTIMDYASYYTAALDDAGYSYQVWDADAHFGGPQTIPDLKDLQRFPVVLWFTGDNTHPDGYFVVETPLTPQDMHILASYLDGGGRIIAVGQNLAEASDVNPDPDPTWGRASFYHNYLGAHWLQTSLFEQGVLPPEGAPAFIGLPNTFLSLAKLDLGSEGDGAHNQNSVDEIAPGGIRDGSDLSLVRPLLRAVVTTSVGSGYVGVAKSCDPALGTETDLSLGLRPRETCSYRSVYYSFGLEGVNDNAGMISRADLLRQSIIWLQDRVTVTLGVTLGSASDLTPIRCQAVSSAAAISPTLGAIVSYRWQVGEGEEARIIQSTKPTISLAFPAEGRYPIAVEATDALGHRAVAQSEVRIVKAGSSTLMANRSTASPGSEIYYQIVARNTSSDSMPISFTMPLPANTEYIAHDGGDFDDNVLSWSGTLAGGTTHATDLQVRVSRALTVSTNIVARATFRAGEDSFTRTAATRIIVTSAVYLPLVLKESP